MQKRNTVTDIENKSEVTKGERKGVGTNQRYGSNRYKLLNISIK